MRLDNGFVPAVAIPPAVSANNRIIEAHPVALPVVTSITKTSTNYRPTRRTVVEHPPHERQALTYTSQGKQEHAYGPSDNRVNLFI